MIKVFKQNVIIIDEIDNGEVSKNLVKNLFGETQQSKHIRYASKNHYFIWLWLDLEVRLESTMNNIFSGLKNDFQTWYPLNRGYYWFSYDFGRFIVVVFADEHFLVKPKNLGVFLLLIICFQIKKVSVIHWHLRPRWLRQMRTDDL